MANADGDITLKIGVVADDARKVASDLHKYMEKTLNKPIDTKAFDGIKKTITETAAKSEKLSEELRTLKSTGADLGLSEQFKQLSESASIAQKKYFALRREAKAVRQAGNIPGAEELEKQVAIADAQRRQLLSQKMTLANTGRSAGSDEFAEKTAQLTELNNQMVLYIKQLERMRSLEATRKQVASETQGPPKATPKKGLSETEDKARVLTESIEQLRRKLEGTDKSIGFLKMDKSIQKTIDDTNALKSKFEQMRAEVYKVTPTEEFAQASAKVKTLQQDVEKYHAKLMELEEMGKTHTQPYADTVFKWNQAQNSLITQLQLMRQMTAAGEDYNRVLWTETEEYNAAITKQQQLNRDLEIGKQRLKESAEYQAYRDKHISSTPQDVKKEGEEAQQTSEKLNELEGQKKRTTKANSELGEESEETASKMRQEKSAAERLKETFVTFGRGVKAIGKGMATVAKATGNFVSRLRGANKQTNETSKSLKNLLKFSLKYFLGLRSIFILYKRIRSAGVEAYKGLASQFPELQAEVNELKNSFFQLKNSLATMAQPILSYLIPAIKTLMGWLSAAMTALANFFAILTGAKYIYKASKANKDWAKSAGGAGKAAKEANEDIAEYDNLILIQQDNDNGGGGGGGAADDYAGAFEKVKAESDLAQEIKDAINKGDWEGVGYALAKRLNNVQKIIDNWVQNKFRPAGKKWASRIARILNGLTDGWDSAQFGKTLSHSLMAVFDIIATFWETYDWNNLGKKIGTAITNLFLAWEPKTVARFLAKKFNALGQFLLGLTDGKDGINFTLVGQKIGETIKSTFEKINWKDLGTGISNFIRGVLTSIRTAIKEADLGNTIASALNNLFAGLNFKSMMSDLAKTANSLVTALGDAIKNTDWDAIGDAFATLISDINWTEVGKTIIITATKLLSIAQKIINGIGDAIDKVDWMEIGQAIADLLASIDWGKLIVTLIKVAGGLIKGIGSALLQIATDPAALGSLATGLLAIFGAKWIWNKVKAVFLGGGASGGIISSIGGGILNRIKYGWNAAGGGTALAQAIKTSLNTALGKVFVGVGTFELAGKIGAKIWKSIWGDDKQLAKEYDKFAETPILYTLNSIKESAVALFQRSTLTAGKGSTSILGNALMDMFSGGKYLEQELESFHNKQQAIRDEEYAKYIDMLERRYKAGKKISEQDKKLLVEQGRIYEANAQHYVEIAQKTAKGVAQARKEAIESSNHYAQIAQKNSITHQTAEKAAENAAIHHAEIAKQQAGVLSESQKEAIKTSNTYAAIAQQNAQKHVNSYKQMEDASNHHANIAKTNAGVYAKAQQDAIDSSNHYVKIAQANNKKVEDSVTTMTATSGNKLAKLGTTAIDSSAIMQKAYQDATKKSQDAFSGMEGAYQGMTEGIKTSVSTIPNSFQSTFTNAYNAITGAFSATNTFFNGVADGVKAPFSTMADYFKTTFTNSWNGVTSVFKSNSPQFQTIQDTVSSTFKGAINSMIGGINNSLLSPFRTLSNAFAKMRGFSINGASPFSGLPTFNVPTIPKLAQGAVLPPNSPFLAVVGDQKSGTNVEAPLDTIVQALQIALENNNNNQPIILNLNGRQVAQAVWDEENKRYKQTGQRFRFS